MQKTNLEAEADRKGQRLSRDERKALRITDLADCSPERRAELRNKAQGTIAYLTASRKTQESNGIPVSETTFQRNIASHVLMLECLDFFRE